MATLDSIANLLQDLSARLKNVEAKVGAGGGPAAVPVARSAGPSLSLPPEFFAAAKSFDETTRAMGKKAIKAAKFMAKIIDFNKDLVAKTATCAAPTAEQKKTMAAQIDKWTRSGEKARLPTRNHEKALHELFLGLFALLHDKPADTVQNQFESLQFHTNRILVEFKGKSEGDNHRNWVKASTDLLSTLKKFCLMEAKRGLKFKGSGDVLAEASAAPKAEETATAAPPAPPAAPAAPAGGPPPPPPPPAPAADPPKSAGGGMGALFASIRNIDQSSGRTKGLKRVKDKDRSCKNRDLVKSSKVNVEEIEQRKAKNAAKKKKKAAAKKVKPAKQYFNVGQNCHYVEFQPDGAKITVEIKRASQAVYLYQCGKCVVEVKGKFKSLTVVNCNKTSVSFDDLISVCEVNNCKSVKMQALGQCPSICIDKTDGCQVWLSAKSLDCGFTCAKISEVNVSWPDPGSEDPESPDWIDKPIPEQYKHTIDTARKVVTANVSDLYSEC